MTNDILKPINPVHWRMQVLRNLDHETVDSLAQRAAGTLTSYRVVLGRCLLALHESKNYREYGCSTAVSYAVTRLGLQVREARACLRVARCLLELPRLSREAEEGRMPWGKLREIVRKASVETESLWIELAKNNTYKVIQKLVGKTPKGALPGDVDAQGDSYFSELRCNLSPEVFQMLEQARRLFSVDRDEAVTTAEVLEFALASYISQQPLDEEALRKVREEADKDLQAERARQIPVVAAARELAVEMGILASEETFNCKKTRAGQIETEAPRQLGATNEGDMQAEGATKSRAGHVLEEMQSAHSELEDLLAQATGGQTTWQNFRLRFNPDSRHTTRAQKTEILRRDGWCCSTPGCPNRAWLHVHHLTSYSEGGRTEPINLISICSGCHRNIHQGFLHIEEESGKLILRDHKGGRLDRQANLELASWIDFRLGWTGTEENCHRKRYMDGDWAGFVG